MSPTTVEEILAAVQELPPAERNRLLDFLRRESISDNQMDLHPIPPAKASDDNARNRVPQNRDAEMNWLLDHPEFCERHRGEHVALWGNEMIAVGRTRKEVILEARRRGIKFPLVQYLPKNEEEWLLGFSNQPLTES